VAINELELGRQHELAEFLRSRRARLLPEQVGLPRGTRRRTPGLRRGEVAQLAGVSPEWYTWLEQGRDITVSVQLLESLARVLQLDEKERDQLFRLALRQPPPVKTFVPPTMSPLLQKFLDQLGIFPAVVLDPRLNAVAWNKAHTAIFGDFGELTERNRNLVWRLFTSPIAAKVNEEWDHLAQVYLAQFRAEYGRFINDPWWAQRIAELNEASPKFRELWPRHDVITVSEGRKTMHHSLVGDLCFEYLLFQPVDAPDLRVLIHIPRAGTGTTEKMERLVAGLAE